MRVLAVAPPLMISVVYLIGVYGLERWCGMPLPSLLNVETVVPERLPKPSPLTEKFSSNTDLLRAQRLFEGQVQGSESVLVDGDGNLLMLDKFGYLHKGTPVGEGGSRSSSGPGQYLLLPHPVAYVGPGRPLGFHLDSSGNLVICDSLKGLTKLNMGDHRLEVLANRASLDSPLDPGSAITYANDLDVAPDGRIFFSDSTAIPPALGRGGAYDTLRSYMLTMWQGGASGRLLVHYPSTRQTHVLVRGLWYANGVALAADGSFVAVVETCSMRVWRHWLEGPKAGSTDLLTNELSGFPDGISQSSDGNFWVSILLPYSPLLRWVLPSRALRWLLAWVPGSLLPSPPQWGLVLKVSPSGEILAALGDPGGAHVSHVSAVTERNGKLFLGNLAKDYVSVLTLA